jgi:hypothetical protein
MEIDLFWKRSSFYWVFVGAALVAYGVLRKDAPHFGLLIASFGFLSSVAWLLGSIGSKWWIENWERKLEESAPSIVGDLFNATDERLTVVPGITLMRFSVTRLAILLSAFVTVLWFVIFAKEVIDSSPGLKALFPQVCEARVRIVTGITVLFLILFLSLARGGNRTGTSTQVQTIPKDS